MEQLTTEPWFRWAFRCGTAWKSTQWYKTLEVDTAMKLAFSLKNPWLSTWRSRLQTVGHELKFVAVTKMNSSVTVRASSEIEGKLARFVNDGNLSTYWTPNYTEEERLSRTKRQTIFLLPWLEIDLGREETVYAVTLRSGLECLAFDDRSLPPTFVGPTKIFVSNDRMREETSFDNETNIAGYFQDSVHHLQKPQKGRFLQLWYTSADLHTEIDFIRIAELIIHTSGTYPQPSLDHIMQRA